MVRSSLSLHQEIYMHTYSYWSNKVICMHGCCFKTPAFSESFHFPRAVQMNMELETDVGSNMLLHKGEWGIGRERRGRWQGPSEGTSAAPGLSSLEGVWTPNSTSLHSENELLTENRWGWTWRWRMGRRGGQDEERVWQGEIGASVLKSGAWNMSLLT